MTVAQDIIIRAALKTDVTALGRLGAQLVRTHHDFDRTRFLAPSAETESGYSWWLGSQLDEKAVIILVAERAGEVVAYSYSNVEGHDWMELRGPAGVVQDIVVDPAHRGHGIGSALLEATVETLRKRGVPQVVLATADKNETAQRLFTRAGFRRTMVEMTLDL